MDVDCPEWLDFLHGGLQFQVEHHLFLRMSRQNLRKCQALLRDFCAKKSIKYHSLDFVGGNKVVLTRFEEISRMAEVLMQCHKSLPSVFAVLSVMAQLDTPQKLATAPSRTKVADRYPGRLADQPFVFSLYIHELYRLDNWNCQWNATGGRKMAVSHGDNTFAVMVLLPPAVWRFPHSGPHPPTRREILYPYHPDLSPPFPPSIDRSRICNGRKMCQTNPTIPIFLINSAGASWKSTSPLPLAPKPWQSIEGLRSGPESQGAGNSGHCGVPQWTMEVGQQLPKRISLLEVGVAGVDDLHTKKC
ncbi:hypothetical protein B0T17DRAFT_506794 [Bombardia bombarda]|uniref:Fatty acid desaturase domain-containing protein n=1 Tax=Bombardia bombarda TaxID=252184 RepID=A0AA39XAG1_9PEZI|nr:hypothetical protein B0T17DRAFT_506794 [Bombardia bombarda]